MKIRDILFEFEDLPWFPGTVRESMTDYLRYFLAATNFYESITPILGEGLRHARAKQVIDMCSGGGGAIEKVRENYQRICKADLPVVLTDKFPNLQAFKLLEEKSGGMIRGVSTSVDALGMPPTLLGLRTIFSGIHHFNEEQVRGVLRAAVAAQESIAIFDGGDKNILTIVGIILFHPLAFLVCTPFFRPLRLSRFMFTYLIPLIPFCTVWDGVVSILRLYSPETLLTLAREVDNERYYWRSGKEKNALGMHVTYLVGYPKITEEYM